MSDVINSVGNFLGGNGSDSGALGVGQYKAGAPQTDYTTSKNALNANQGIYNNMGQLLTNTENRSAPQAANTTLGPTSLVNAATGTAATGSAVTGQAAQGTNVATSANSQIAPDSTKFLGQQQGLINQLSAQAQGQGPSLAANQLAQGEQTQVANQLALLGSQAGAGNRSLAARSAADQSAQALNSLNQNTANARIQEQLNAQSQLGQNLSNASGQLIGLNENQAALNQANNQFNASNQNALNSQNLSNQQQTALANLSAQNSIASQNLQNQQATNLANLGNQQAANVTNAGALNAQNLAQGQLNQQTSLQNLSAQLQSMGLNDNQIDALLSGQAGINQSAINQNLQQNSQGIQAGLGTSQINAGAYQNAAANRGNLVGGIMQGASAALPLLLSDMNVKTGITGGNAMMGSFLEHMRSASDAGGGVNGMGYSVQTAGPSDLGAGVGAAGKGLAGMLGKKPAPTMDNLDQQGLSFGEGLGADAAPAAEGLSSEGAASALAALSDEREKTDTHNPSSDDVQGFLDKLHAYSYRYKDPDAPGAGHGERLGVMAQDVEKSDLGKNFVKENDDGRKMIDGSQMLSTLLASNAYLNDRLNKLEGKKG